MESGIELKERNESRKRILSIYVILRFFHSPKTFQRLSFETGIAPTSLYWYKTELMTRGYIEPFDRIYTGMRTVATRYRITEKGRKYMAKLENVLTVRNNRHKRKSPVRYVGEIPWERVEKMLDQGLGLTQICKELDITAAGFYGRWKNYHRTEKRKKILADLKEKGELKSDVDEMFMRSPRHKYPLIPWPEVEILISQGHSLLSIARKYGIGYSAFKGRFDRYVKAGDRQKVLEDLVIEGKITKRTTPILERNRRLREDPPRRKHGSTTDEG
ncbi:MAG: hypothetical protein M1151_04240 [Candidatus Thermoplasmatota archaeon]|nr:hypothetical protein [Candidatus Thermoplasmatota archaeon]MCL5785864.1 hypothetical protein [Candidatus Thermoplasmatota archaeon]